MTSLYKLGRIYQRETWKDINDITVSSLAHLRANKPETAFASEHVCHAGRHRQVEKVFAGVEGDDAEARNLRKRDFFAYLADFDRKRVAAADISRRDTRCDLGGASFSVLGGSMNFSRRISVLLAVGLVGVALAWSAARGGEESPVAEQSSLDLSLRETEILSRSERATLMRLPDVPAPRVASMLLLADALSDER